MQLDDLDFEEIQNQLNTQENAGQISEYLSETLSKLNQDDFGILSGLFEIKNKIGKLSELSSEYLD
ncbi:MAG: DNA repair protein RecN, partial [Sphingobacteriaceae bacterium]